MRVYGRENAHQSGANIQNHRMTKERNRRCCALKRSREERGYTPRYIWEHVHIYLSKQNISAVAQFYPSSQKTSCLNSFNDLL